MIISFSPEGKVYRLSAGARGFFAPTGSSGADFQPYPLWDLGNILYDLTAFPSVTYYVIQCGLLTVPPGRKHNISVVKRGDSYAGVAIYRAAKKAISYQEADQRMTFRSAWGALYDQHPTGAISIG